MLEEPEIIQTAPQQTAYIHVVVPRPRIGQVMRPALQELHAAVATQGIEITGPWFTHHRRLHEEEFDFELSLPVASPIQPTGRVQAGVWPAMTMARTVYHGAYDGLGEAWERFDDRLAADGHLLTDELREIYRLGPESGLEPSEFQTELCRQLHQAPAAAEPVA